MARFEGGDATVIRLSFNTKVRLTQFAGIVALLGLLEVMTRTGRIDTLTAAPPTRILQRVLEMAMEGKIWSELYATLFDIGSALTLAIAAGLVIGVFLWYRSRIYDAIAPYLTAYYAIPIFAFYPALISIFGLNHIPIVLIGAGYAVVAIIVSTVTGLRATPRIFVRVARSYGISPATAFRRIYLRAAAPSIFGGIRLGASYALVGVIASEFILSPGGLGYLVGFNYNNFNTLDLYATLVIIIAIATLFTSIFSKLERKARRNG